MNLTGYSIRKQSFMLRSVRAWIRKRANAHATAPIAVVSGAGEPVLRGVSWHYTTQGGRPVYHPSAYRRAWGKPVYHASTLRVEVGTDWLRAHGIAESDLFSERDLRATLRALGANV